MRRMSSKKDIKKIKVRFGDGTAALSVDESDDSTDKWNDLDVGQVVKYTVDEDGVVIFRDLVPADTGRI